MGTCLFTGEPLGPHTTKEHIIPSALGGGITSTTVLSSDFNNKCSPLDSTLVALYHQTLLERAPLLAVSRQVGDLKTTTDAGWPITLRAGGHVDCETHVRARHDNSRPSLIAKHPHDRRTPEQLGMLGRYEVTELRTVDGAIEPPREPLFSAKAEVAALRVVLGMLDYLSPDPSRSVARCPELADARSHVRDFVRLGRQARDRHDRLVLGIQYERSPEVASAVTRHKASLADFEHVFVVSSNQASRTLDAVWIVAGIDPFGFRLSSHWSDMDWTLIATFDPVTDEDEPQVSRWRFPTSVCMPTLRKFSHRLDKPEDILWMRPLLDGAVNEVRSHRTRMYQHAVLLTETHCRDWLDRLINETRARISNESDALGYIEQGCMLRLHSLFKLRLESSGRAVCEVVSVAPLSAALAKSIEMLQGSDRDWGAVAKCLHRAYTEVLGAIAERLGPPGEVIRRRAA